MSDEPRKTLIGVIETEQDEALALHIPPGADTATMRAAILKANAERAAAAKRETARLAELFLIKVAIERGDK